MPLTATGDLVAAAAKAGTGCPAFNVVGLEHAAAVVAAAEQRGQPLIVQVSQNAVRYHGELAPIGTALMAMIRRARTPIALHLDHADTAELVGEAVDLGFTSVMFDASSLDYTDNVRTTAHVVRTCHERGVWVEAELGEIGGKDGVHAAGARTDPAQAERYVRDTGVDALAVAVGSSHAMLSRDAVLDFELITRLREVVRVPLVLHGSSGVSDLDLAGAVQAGLTKINIATQLNKMFTAAVRASLAADAGRVDPRLYLGAGRAAVTSEVLRLLDVVRPATASATPM